LEPFLVRSPDGSIALREHGVLHEATAWIAAIALGPQKDGKYSLTEKAR
jgi:hypothetical protein